MHCKFLYPSVQTKRPGCNFDKNQRSVRFGILIKILVDTKRSRGASYRKSQKKNLLYSIYVCTERTFDRRPLKYNKIFFEKALIEVGSSNIYASFALKLVNYLSHSEIINFQKNSKLASVSFKNDFIVFKHFKNSLCLQKLTNWNAKGTKRTVKM